MSANTSTQHQRSEGTAVDQAEIPDPEVILIQTHSREEHYYLSPNSTAQPQQTKQTSL